MNKLHLKLAIGVFLTILISGCITSEYNVATHTQDIYFYSTEKEVNIGRNVSSAIHKDQPVSKNPKINQRVFDIGRRISAVCDRQEINYYFYVIDKDEVNAFSLPGGYIYIYRGLLNRLENDDQLAAVLAHEVGHIVARHNIKRLQASIASQLLLVASSQVSSSGNISSVQGTGLILATILSGYSQKDEFVSDKLAVKYTRKAGFDPKEAIEVMNKLEEANKEKGPREKAYFRSHPYIPQRIRRIKQSLGIPLDFRDVINY